MVSPVAQRPLGQLVIGLAVYAATLWTDGWLRNAILIFCIAAAPASVAILGRRASSSRRSTRSPG